MTLVLNFNFFFSFFFIFSFWHICNLLPSWFQTFTMFWMLCTFLWVISWHLNFVCQHFGTSGCTIFIDHVNTTNEAGTDRLFQNVGTYNSDTGASLKRKNTTLLTYISCMLSLLLYGTLTWSDHFSCTSSSSTSI